MWGTQNHAFLYTNGQVVDLGTLGAEWSEARDINDSGQVVGRFGSDSPSFNSAFLYDGIMHDLGALVAWAINDAGVITGGNVILRNGVVTQFPPPLYGAQDINNLDHVVGGDPGCEGRGFLVTPNAAIDLTAALPPGSGWVLCSANGINDAGQIVGIGRINGNKHAFLLTPLTCGNGVLDAGEECDDGNTVSSDGCDMSCRVEFCFVCLGEPSACTPENGSSTELAQCEADLLVCEAGLAACVSGPPLAQCQQDLTQCSSDLTECATDLAQYSATVADLMRDTDGDGRPDSDDQCPGTTVGSDADLAGCSLEQFCTRVDVSTSAGRRICRKSDWKNDEPVMRSRERDCTMSSGVPGLEDDRCVPNAP